MDREGEGEEVSKVRLATFEYMKNLTLHFSFWSQNVVDVSHFN